MHSRNGAAAHLGRTVRRVAATLSAWAALASAARPALGQAAPDAPPTAPAGYQVEVWAAREGLRGNEVLWHLVRTPDGYLWMLAASGLTRFDGTSFTAFNAENTPQFRGTSNRQRPLLLDRRGRLWIATATGLVAYAGGTFHEGPRYAGGVITLVEDGDGTLWGRTTTDLLWRSTRAKRASADDSAAGGDGLDGGARMEPVSIAGLPSTDLTGLAVDAAGAVWVSARGRGIVRVLHGGTDRPVVQPLSGRDGVPEGSAWRVSAATAGAVWLAAVDSVARVDGGRTRFVPLNADATPGGSTALVYDVEEAPDGTAWIATSAGLLRHDPRDGSLQRFDRRNGLATSRVTSLQVDPHGSVWAATSEGLNRVRRADVALRTPRDAAGTPTGRIECLAAGGGGRLWLGAEDGGVWAAGPDADAPLERVAKFSPGTIRDMRAGLGDTLWIVPADRRLTRVVGTRVWREDSTALNQSVLQDASGAVWLGVYNGGLRRLHGGRETRVGASAVTFRLNPLNLEAGAPGVLWAGGPEGVARVAGDTVRGYRNEAGGDDAVSLRGVRSLYRTRDGAVWVGTHDGLTRVTETPRGPRFATLRGRHGLPGSWVLEMVEDGRGNLWLLQLDEIVRVPLAELHAVADGAKTTLGGVTAFGARDGATISGLGFASGCKNAERAADGRLWFATTGGLLVIDPARVSRDTVRPQAHVVEMLVDGLPAAATGGAVDLPDGARRVELRYTGVDLRAGEGVRFQHRLAGFDPGWVEAGTARTVSYTNLKPGRYRFHVRARSAAGVWSARAATLDLRVPPPFHRTPAFVLAAAAAVAAVLWAAHRARERALQARFAAVLGERTRVAREMHDTLLSGVTGIVLRLESMSQRAAADRQDAMAAALTETCDVTERMVAEARRAVGDLRSPVAEAGLCATLSETAPQLFAGTPVAVRVEQTGEPRALPADAEAQVVRIVREALTNARKHADCRHVEVRCAYGVGELVVTVRDDGRGFDTAAGGTPAGHWGLTGMRERARECGGELRIESGAGAGTTVTLVVRDRTPWRAFRAGLAARLPRRWSSRPTR